MKFYDEDIDGPTLREAHNRYINDFLSLDRTVDWLRSEYGISMNRQRLSRTFKANSMFVFSPNGWPDVFFENLTDHLSPISKLCAKIIETAWEDMFDPTNRIDYLSAAVFIAGEFYEQCLGTIAQNVRHTTVNRDMLPEGITIDEIIEGREIYDRNYFYWLGA